MSKAIWALEKEREKYSGEASDTAAKYQQVRWGRSCDTHARGVHV